MAHTSSKRWTQLEPQISAFSEQVIQLLNSSEEAYQQFQEIYQYAGSTDAGLAALLFQDENGLDSAGDPNPATTEQIAIVADAKAAMVSLHELYQAANNVAVAQADRMTSLRRMV